jgi:putative lipase involved disintegration of autophagic bodies
MVNRGAYDKRDVLTDAKLIFGYKDKSRFNEAREILNKVKNKYPDKTIDMISHSLGAAVAEDLGNDPRVKNVITLNKPTTPYDLIKNLKLMIDNMMLELQKTSFQCFNHFKKIRMI